MNTIQKIILTIWFLLYFAIIICCFTAGIDLWGQEEIWQIIKGSISLLIIIGIPTFFLYKIWADKK